MVIFELYKTEQGNILECLEQKTHMHYRMKNIHTGETMLYFDTGYPCKPSRKDKIVKLLKENK